MILKENYPLQPGPSITMFSYEYLDFFQLEFCSDNSLDYDFDTHVARYADIFGLDEKGLKDDYHPIQMIPPASDSCGSSDSSDSSRSPSIAQDNVKAELSDAETSSPQHPPSKDLERIRYKLTCFSRFNSDILVDPLINHVKFAIPCPPLVQPPVNWRFP